MPSCLLTYDSLAGLKEHIDTFMYHNVSGELLLQLTKKDIEEELEIKKLGHRELLYDEIVKLKQMAARRGARGLSEGYARISQPPQSQVHPPLHHASPLSPPPHHIIIPLPL